MNREEVKEYLKEIRNLDIEIDEKGNDLESYRTLAVKMTQILNPESVQSSGSKDKVGELAVKITEIENEIISMISNLIKEKRKRTKFIQQIPDPLQRNIITMRYIRFMKCWKIAEIKNIDKTTIWRLENKALDSLAEIIDKNA